MTDDPPPDAATDPDAVVTICPSCLQLHPDRYVCVCLVTRAAALAEEAHEVRRLTTPAWRRARPWDALPERARQDATADAMVLVDALEGAGWRLTTLRGDGRHTALEDMRTPPSGAFSVPNVVRS